METRKFRSAKWKTNPMTNTNISYEVIWEASENLYTNDPADTNSIITEIIAKLTVYKTLNTTEVSLEEQNKAKHYLMGNILSTLSHLTYKDNTNIYTALQDALRNHKLDKMEALNQRL